MPDENRPKGDDKNTNVTKKESGNPLAKTGAAAISVIGLAALPTAAGAIMLKVRQRR